MDDLAFKPATTLLKGIKDQRISAVELLEHYIDRIERLNSRINAIVATDYENARVRAEAADAAIEKGESWGPLHGLPITIKDSIEVVGMPCTAGSPELKEYFPQKNADVVQSLLDSGAIIFGKTNLPLFAMDFQSYNKVYGQTNNPWDTDLTPGGSSGGAAAALAAGLTGLEIGSDIGGSIRTPAHFCGLFGHKATFNIIPMQGHIPPLSGLFSDGYSMEGDIATIGPMARSARDLDMVMDLIVKPGVPQRKAWNITLPPPRKERLKDYRIGLWLDDPAFPVDDAVAGRIQAVVDELAKAGAGIENKRPDIDFGRSHEIYVALLAGVSGSGLPENIFTRLMTEAQDLKESDISPKARFIRGATQSHRLWMALDRERLLMRQKWAQFFNDFDVLLCPAAPVTAFAHDHSDFYDRTLKVNHNVRSYVNTLYAWAGLTGVVYLPSTIAPAGLTSEGLPVGIQIVGSYLEDRTTIHLAKLIEDEMGGFVPPPGLE